MEFLDLRTILVSYTLCNLVCAIVLFSLWKQNRNRFAGLDYFMTSFVINFFGILLLALRDVIPDFFSLLFGNVFLIAGVLILYIGICRFLDRKIKQIHNYVLLAIYVALQTWLIYGYPNLEYRMILFSAMISIYCSQITWMLFSNKEKRVRSTVIGLGVLSIIYWFIGIVRIGYEFISPIQGDLFDFSRPFETYIYLMFQLVYIVLTFYLFIIVNRRLFFDLEDELIIQKQTESDLNLSQEKFLKAFHASPNSVLLTRLNDGKLLEVNERFVHLSGYSREELLSSTTLSLKFWVDPEERNKVVSAIKKDGQIKEYEFDGRTRSGKILRFLYSGVMININDEVCMISYIEDITERKKIETVLNLRVKLWEFAADHSTPELLQKVLDEIEILTKSSIGFFHLIDQKNGDLVLQAWSTNTSKKFCKAEGQGMHYPIDKAGVWCDSVREKKAIIHNDYASLQNRKGMPEGHATVTRELVVPILRENKVVAVLGIGNKDTEYGEKDIDLVTDIANLAWEIIIENQSEEKILELNNQLEKLAMTDELTGLYNRRAFFMKGTEEIIRTRRYRAPFSVIMLDIDKFKRINDTLGHEYGDRALQCLAKILSDGIREVDTVGRLGGEEFGILLPNTMGEEAVVLAERLRMAVEQKGCEKREHDINMTASFGVAELTIDMKNLDDLIRNADIAMYQAKNTGRNRVVLFNGSLSS